jgi:hypothetical protein
VEPVEQRVAQVAFAVQMAPLRRLQDPVETVARGLFRVLLVMQVQALTVS